MVRGKEAAAEKSLRQLRNRNIAETEFQAELREIRGSTREQLEMNKKAVLLEMWRGTNLRRTLLCIAVVCFHAGNGSSWVNIYTTYYLEIAGVQNPFGYSIMMTCMGLLGVLISITFIRQVDRRVIMLVGTFACGVCQLAQAITWSVVPGSEEAGNVVVAFIALFTFFYVAYGEFGTARLALTTNANRSHSSVCMAPGGRVSQYRHQRVRLRLCHRSQFLGELARHLHSAVLHQPGCSRLVRSVWLHLVRLEHDPVHLHLVLHPRDAR